MWYKYIYLKIHQTFETKTYFQDGRCCSEAKEMENSLESPLHLGEYHVVTLQRRDRMVTLQKVDQSNTHQRFQTVRALPSESQFTLRQGIKYNTSNKPVSDFNMSGYYLKPAGSQRRQSLEDWCQGVPGSQGWSPSESWQGDLDAEGGGPDFEGGAGYTEGASAGGAGRKGGSGDAAPRADSILAIYNQKPRPATNTAMTDRDRRKTMNPKVFSISKTVGRGNYCNEHSQQVGEELNFGRLGAGQGKE